MYVHSFFNDALGQDKPDKSYQSLKKIYDLIYELNLIAPSLLTPALPQLECKIKSSHESERLKAVAMLLRMFSEKDSTLARHFGRRSDQMCSEHNALSHQPRRP